MKNKKKHLTKEERYCIEKLCRQGYGVRHIAFVLGRGKTTIADEIRNNGGQEKYDAHKAQHRAYLKQYWKKKDCLKVAMSPHIATFVERKLRALWSPECISGYLKKHTRGEYVSPKAIRRYITSRSGLERYLFHHRVHKKPGPKRKRDIFLSDPGRRSIDERPNVQGVYGHWEGDFIVSRWSRVVLLVLVEKVSGKTLLKLLPNRNNDVVNHAVASILSTYYVKSLTLDNDIAFLKWRELESYINAPIYFCHPYCSWEKGLVENTNRWIRQFIPKKSDLTLVTEHQLHDILVWLNHRPRKRNDFETSHDMMMRLARNFHQLPMNWGLVSGGSVRIWE